MAKSAATELKSLIVRLEKERAEHVAKIAEIDAIFESYGIGARGKSRKAVRITGAGRRKVTVKRKKRGTFKKTGEQSVLDFIKSKPNSTSADINKHWSNEGRGGRADNTLTKLVKAKKLKRIPIKGQRGGKYKVA